MISLRLTFFLGDLYLEKASLFVHLQGLKAALNEGEVRRTGRACHLDT
jgi:hypothetical protein